ncbi:carotenoid oxygenase, partial [Ochromonadaceae sp. CCMP2298]
MSALVLLCTALAVCWRADAFSAMAPTTALASTATRDLGIGMDDLWTSCLDEVPVPRQMKVEGEIPDYVKGTLLRNGPSVFEALKESGENHRYKHIFDGLARVVSYTFPGDGSVAFSTKLIRSKFHEQVVQRRGDLPAGVTTGGTVPPFSVLKNVLGLVAGPSYDNCNVNIHQIGGSGGPVVAVTDAPAMMPLDNQLNTPGLLKHPNKITTGLGVELFSTAHPHCIPGDKYSYNYYLELKPLGNNLAHIVRTDQHFKRTIVGSVEIGQDHAVLAIWPLSSDVSTTPNGKGFLPQLVWEGNKNTKIYVFDIENSRSQGTQGTQGSQGTQGTQEDVSTPPHAPPPVAVFETEPLFAYHHVNCYERGDGLVLDLLAYKNA